MATGVGLRIGNGESVAAVVSDSAPTTPQYLVRTSELPTTAAPTTPDPTLIATSMLALLGDVTTRIAPPDSIVATYPADWTVETVEAVQTSLLSIGLDEVALIADDGTPTDHEAAYRGARIAAAALSPSTTTLVVPRLTPRQPLAYSAMPEPQGSWATSLSRPAPQSQPAPPSRPAPQSWAPTPRPVPARVSPPTMEFAPIRTAPARQKSASPAIAGVFLLAFALSIVAALFYLNPDLAKFSFGGGTTNESTDDSSNFTPITVTPEETTRARHRATEKASKTSESSTTSEIPTTSPTTSTSEPTLTKSAGSGPLRLG